MITLTDVDITTKREGQNTVATLNGAIAIQEGRGRLVIYDPITQRELNVVDNTGYLFSDATDRRIKLGLKPDLSDVGLYISKAGEDVIDLLEA